MSWSTRGASALSCSSSGRSDGEIERLEQQPAQPALQTIALGIVQVAAIAVTACGWRAERASRGADGRRGLGGGGGTRGGGITSALSATTLGASTAIGADGARDLATMPPATTLPAPSPAGESAG